MIPTNENRRNCNNHIDIHNKPKNISAYCRYIFNVYKRCIRQNKKPVEKINAENVDQR